MVSPAYFRLLEKKKKKKKENIVIKKKEMFYDFCQAEKKKNIEKNN